jgi:hypothetical protein
MNILQRNPADREAKSPCDKNIRYPVCVPRHDSPNGTTFSGPKAGRQSTRVIRSLGSSTRAVFFILYRYIYNISGTYFQTMGDINKEQ